MGSKVIREWRAGHVRLTLWEHEEGRKSLTVSRLYKDPKTGEWRSCEGLAVEDLPDLLTVALEANRLLRVEERDEPLLGTQTALKRV